MVLLLVFEKLNKPRIFSVKDEFRKILELYTQDASYLKEFLNSCKKVMYLNYTDTDFLTSDYPVGMERIQDSNQLAFIVFPVNRKICFIFMNKEVMGVDELESHKQYLEQDNIDDVLMVEMLNTSIASKARRHIFSSSSELTESIKKINYKSFLDL